MIFQDTTLLFIQIINADEQLIFHVTGSGQSRGTVENSGTTSGFILEATLTYFTDA